MISYYGDFAEDDTVLIPFNTFDSNDPSASVTITNLADADIKVHKDGSVTQIVTDGATVAIDFDTITGNHLVTIDTSAHADYATGSEYAVRIEGTTVGGATINAWIGAFSIERAGGVLALIKAGNLSANVVQLGGVTQSLTDLKDFADAGYDPATNKVQGVVLTDTLTTYTGNTLQTGDVTTAINDLANGTDGLGALKALIDTVNTDLSNGTDGLGALKALIDALNDIAAADIWAVDATTQQTQGTFGQAIGDPVADTTTIYQSVATDAAGDNVSVDVAAVKAETALIVADTNELQTDDVPTLIAAVQSDTDDLQTQVGTAGAGLTAINLPNQTMDITGSLSGSVGSVTGSVGSNLELGPAEVNAEVLDVMNVDTFAEPGQGTPGATISVFAKINYLYKAWRNKSLQNATTYELYNDDAATVDQKATVSDDGTDAIKGEVATGP